MSELRDQVLNEFRKVAEDCDAEWSVSEDCCEFSKNGITVRVRWSVEHIPGVFVTLMKENKNQASEYGLPYLVEFRHGEPQDLAKASSDDPKLTADVFRKYASSLLDGTAQDFSAFTAFAAKRIRNNLSA